MDRLREQLDRHARSCGNKIKFPTKVAAKSVLRRLKNQHSLAASSSNPLGVYRCGPKGDEHWHIGHRPSRR